MARATPRRRCYTRAMRSQPFSLAILLLLPALTFAQTARHAFTLDDIAKLQRVGSPTLSPDGQRVAYSVTTIDTIGDRDQTHLWQVNWDGTQNRRIADDVSKPRYSPDSRTLSFLSSRSGSAQVWAQGADGQPKQLTSVKQSIVDYRWSPDSTTLLLTLRDTPPAAQSDSKPHPIIITRYQYKDDHEGYVSEAHNHLYLYNLARRTLTRLLHEKESDEEASAEWSPNGRSIAFISQRGQPDPDRTENTDLYIADATPGSTARKLTTFAGVQAAPLVWSSDSRRIAYRQANVAGYSSYSQLQPAVLSATGGPAQIFGAQLDRPIGTPFFTPDGNALLTSVVDDRNVYAERIPLDGSAPTRLMHGEGVVADMLSQNSHTLVLWSDDTHIPELYAMNSDGTLRAITHVNDAALATLALQPAQNISAHTPDNVEVHGLLTLPTNYREGMKVPLLLYIHGGPVSQDAHDFTLTRQVFAAHGYAVLNVNYRGSNGRGFAYSHAIEAKWGDKELLDLNAMVDAVIATGSIDPDKLVVGGWSYGGILTDNLIATTNRFKAASSGAGRGNLIGLYGVSEYVLQYDSELGQPWKNPALYMKLSYPFFHADQIKTPTLFMGGDRDFNVPLAGSEQMYQALRSAGTPTELIVYPGQHHVFTRPSFIVDRYQRWFDWYDSYIAKPAKEPAQ